MNPKTSMRHRGNPLANSEKQLVVLSPAHGSTRFGEKLRTAGYPKLTSDGIEVLQVNLGKLCNMTCEHCHVDAGPDRREIMQKIEIQACLDVLRPSTNPYVGPDRWCAGNESGFPEHGRLGQGAGSARNRSL